MLKGFGVYSAGLFAVAAVLALIGTNAQAQLARGRLLNNDDPDIAMGGRLWRPSKWLVKPSTRRSRAHVEAVLKSDADKWARYQALVAELWAWNALETSVALALIASVVGLIVALLS